MAWMWDEPPPPIIPKTKRCSKCLKTKPIGEFYKQRSGPHGRRSQCKTCIGEYNAAHPEDRRARERKRRAADPENRRAQDRKHYAVNRKKIDARRRKLRAANLETARARDRASARKRRAANPLAHRLKSALRNALTANGHTKTGRTFSILGYTPEQLRAHLTRTLPKGATLESALASHHIDHITPVSAFNWAGDATATARRAFALDNLRLIPAVENLRKNAKLIKPHQRHLGI